MTIRDCLGFRPVEIFKEDEGGVSVPTPMLARMRRTREALGV